jgi:hypothetical protein
MRRSKKNGERRSRSLTYKMRAHKTRRSEKKTKRSKSSFSGGACTSEDDPISGENIIQSVPLLYRISIPTGQPNLEHCFDFRQLFQWFKIPKYDANGNRVFINPFTNLPFSNQVIYNNFLLGDPFDGRGYGKVLEVMRIIYFQDYLSLHYRQRLVPELQITASDYGFWLNNSILGQSSFFNHQCLRPILTSLNFQLEDILLDPIIVTLEFEAQHLVEIPQPQLVLPPNEQQFFLNLPNTDDLNEHVRDATDAFLLQVANLGNFGAQNWQIRDFLKHFLATGRSSVLTSRIFYAIFSDIVSGYEILKLVKTFINLANPEIRTFCLQMYPDPDGSID